MKAIWNMLKNEWAMYSILTKILSGLTVSAMLCIPMAMVFPSVAFVLVPVGVLMFMVFSLVSLSSSEMDRANRSDKCKYKQG
jgi:hypothetical protein